MHSGSIIIAERTATSSSGACGKTFGTASFGSGMEVNL